MSFPIHRSLTGKVGNDFSQPVPADGDCHKTRYCTHLILACVIGHFETFPVGIALYVKDVILLGPDPNPLQSIINNAKRWPKG